MTGLLEEEPCNKDREACKAESSDCLRKCREVRGSGCRAPQDLTRIREMPERSMVCGTRCGGYWSLRSRSPELSQHLSVCSCRVQGAMYIYIVHCRCSSSPKRTEKEVSPPELQRLYRLFASFPRMLSNKKVCPAALASISC